EVGLQRHRAIGREDGHAIARLHAELPQGSCLTFHASAEFGVGEAAVAFDDRGEVAPGMNAAGQEVERSKRRDHEVALSYPTKGLYVNKLRYSPRCTGTTCPVQPEFGGLHSPWMLPRWGLYLAMLAAPAIGATIRDVSDDASVG